MHQRIAVSNVIRSHGRWTLRSGGPCRWGSRMSPPPAGCQCIRHKSPSPDRSSLVVGQRGHSEGLAEVVDSGIGVDNLELHRGMERGYRHLAGIPRHGRPFVVSPSSAPRGEPGPFTGGGRYGFRYRCRRHGDLNLAITSNPVNQSGRDLPGIGSQQSELLPPPTASSTYSRIPAPLPSPSDFTIGVKVLEKKCIGSAGCNVSYRIEPQYTGLRSLDGNTFIVIYEVTGGEDGPQINNFEVRSSGTIY